MPPPFIKQKQSCKVFETAKKAGRRLEEAIYPSIYYPLISYELSWTARVNMAGRETGECCGFTHRFQDEPPRKSLYMKNAAFRRHAYGFRAAGDIQFRQDVIHMEFDRSFRNGQAGADLFITAPFAQKLQHL